MKGTAIRVGLVDDHQMLRDGLRRVLEETEKEIEVVADASSAIEALQLIDAYGPDVLVTDISMPGIGGIELAKRIGERGPRPRVIVLSMYDDADLIERAVKAGVWGYLLKEDAAATVVEAIETVHAGERYFSSSIPATALIAYEYSASDDEASETRLTRRQLEVLGLICDGRTEREIAAELGISPHTAHVHKNNILKSLNLHSKVDLVKYAIRHNLLRV